MRVSLGGAKVKMDKANAPCFFCVMILQSHLPVLSAFYLLFSTIFWLIVF